MEHLFKRPVVSLDFLYQTVTSKFSFSDLKNVMPFVFGEIKMPFLVRESSSYGVRKGNNSLQIRMITFCFVKVSSSLKDPIKRIYSVNCFMSVFCILSR